MTATKAVTMTYTGSISTSQAAIAEINRGIDAVTAEIAARPGDQNDSETARQTDDSSPQRPRCSRRLPRSHAQQHDS